MIKKEWGQMSAYFNHMLVMLGNSNTTPRVRVISPKLIFDTLNSQYGTCAVRTEKSDEVLSFLIVLFINVRTLHASEQLKTQVPLCYMFDDLRNKCLIFHV